MSSDPRPPDDENTEPQGVPYRDGSSAETVMEPAPSTVARKDLPLVKTTPQIVTGAPSTSLGVNGGPGVTGAPSTSLGVTGAIPDEPPAPKFRAESLRAYASRTQLYDGRRKYRTVFELKGLKDLFFELTLHNLRVHQDDWDVEAIFRVTLPNGTTRDTVAKSPVKKAPPRRSSSGTTGVGRTRRTWWPASTSAKPG